MRRALCITVLSTVAGLAQAQTPAPFDCSSFLNFGNDSSSTWQAFQSSPEKMAWDWFVCLNQPATDGTPNRLWETLKPTDQVYLSNGGTPLPYAQRVPTPQAVLDKAATLGMDSKRIFQNLDSTQQVDGLAVYMGNQVPAAQSGQPVRFHLQMNQDTFDYIVQKQVYNLDGQVALTSNLNFPSTAWELKTAWLWIGADPTFMQQLTNDGYYIIQGYYQTKDGQYHVGYAALSGMHVINKLNVDWVWTTFENVNNPKYTVTNDTPPQPLTNITGPTPAAKAVNGSYQSGHPALSRYELIGVQYNFNQGLLANSQLESAFQGRSSCIACHDTAAYSKDKGPFNFVSKNGGVAYPVTQVPDSEFVGYQKLDYVWSLKRAQWKR